MSSHSYGFYISQWQTKKSEILQLRESVLVREFGAQNSIMQNPEDPDSFHVIAYDEKSNAIGTGCMTKEGLLGHVVVLNQWRRRTIGKAIILYLINIAKIRNLACVVVESPESMIGFYLSLEFDRTDVTEIQNGNRLTKLIRLITKSNSIVH